MALCIDFFIFHFYLHNSRLHNWLHNRLPFFNLSWIFSRIQSWRLIVRLLTTLSSSLFSLSSYHLCHLYAYLAQAFVFSVSWYVSYVNINVTVAALISLLHYIYTMTFEQGVFISSSYDTANTKHFVNQLKKLKACNDK